MWWGGFSSRKRARSAALSPPPSPGARPTPGPCRPTTAGPAGRRRPARASDRGVRGRWGCSWVQGTSHLPGPVRAVGRPPDHDHAPAPPFGLRTDGSSAVLGRMTSSSSPAADLPDLPDASAGAGRDAPLRRMTARGRGEPHRVASPLELFFDLCFVVAVAQAARQLHPRRRRGPRRRRRPRLRDGVLRDLVGLDELHLVRLGLRQRRRALPARDARADRRRRWCSPPACRGPSTDHDFAVVSLGYVIMRLAAGRAVAAGRPQRQPAPSGTTALRYAAGVLLCQVGWVAAAGPAGAWPALGVPGDGRSPSWRSPSGPSGPAATTWHPHHIAERYGLFTIIVLGETIAAATVAVKSGARRSTTRWPSCCRSRRAGC